MKKKILKIGEKAVKFVTGVILKAKEDERIIEGIATMEIVDRDGDTILIDGIDIKNFKKNATMPWGHDYRGLPVAKILKIWKGTYNGKKVIFFRAQFAGMAQAHPQAEAVYRLLKDGFLKSFSIGFIPKEFEENKKTNGYMITKSELLEVSVVTVPANPEALVTAAKSFGIDLEEIKSLWESGAFKTETDILKETKSKREYENKKKKFEKDFIMIDIQDEMEFEEDSFITRELQANPPILGVYGKFWDENPDDDGDPKLKTVIFPRTDWTEEEAGEWTDKHREELEKKEYTLPKGVEPIKFLTNLLAEKHEELKVMRKYFAKFSEAVGVDRTDNELETIREIGLKLIALLEQFKIAKTKTKKTESDPPKKKEETKESDPLDDLLEGADVLQCQRGITSPKTANRSPSAKTRTVDTPEEADLLDLF